MRAHPKASQRLIARVVAAVALAAILAGCVTSKQPLFDPAQAVTPLADGTLIEESRNQGKWVKWGTIKLVRDGRIYSAKSDRSDNVPNFALHDVGDGFYVAVHTRAPNKESIYALFEKQGDSYLYYAPICSEFQYVRLPRSLWPVIDGEYCSYDNRETLVQALRVYARLSNPVARYTPAKP